MKDTSSSRNGAERIFPICKDHMGVDWNQPTLDDDACVLCRLFYLEAQEGLLEEAQQRAKKAEDDIKDMERPLDAQMARLNAEVTRLNGENELLRARLARSEKECSKQVPPGVCPADDPNLEAKGIGEPSVAAHRPGARGVAPSVSDDRAGTRTPASCTRSASESSELQQEVETLREYANVVTKENERLMAQVSNLEHTVADVIAERDAARSSTAATRREVMVYANCPRCGAKDESEAQSKCLPGEDQCPMTCRENWTDALGEINERLIMEQDGVYWMMQNKIDELERAVRSASEDRGWIWSLEEPEVSGSRWIETWDASKLELGVRRFTVGDSLPPNVACWRYVDPPSATADRRAEKP